MSKYKSISLFNKNEKFWCGKMKHNVKKFKHDKMMEIKLDKWGKNFIFRLAELHRDSAVLFLNQYQSQNHLIWGQNEDP